LKIRYALSKKFVKENTTDIPEQAFYMKGGIEEVVEAAKAMAEA
jgi:F0F1-type ATP synthase beta subunit